MPKRCLRADGMEAKAGKKKSGESRIQCVDKSGLGLRPSRGYLSKPNSFINLSASLSSKSGELK